MYATCFGIFSYFSAFLVFIISLSLAISPFLCIFSCAHDAFNFLVSVVCVPQDEIPITSYCISQQRQQLLVRKFNLNRTEKRNKNKNKKCRKSHSPTKYQTLYRAANMAAEAAAAAAAAFERNLWVTLFMHSLLCHFSAFLLFLVVMMCFASLASVSPHSTTQLTNCYYYYGCRCRFCCCVFCFLLVLPFSHTFVRSVSIAFAECEWGLCIRWVLHIVSHRFLCSTGADAYARTRFIASNIRTFSRLSIVFVVVAEFLVLDY